jgi:hypothetical protein
MEANGKHIAAAPLGPFVRSLEATIDDWWTTHGEALQALSG